MGGGGEGKPAIISVLCLLDTFEFLSLVGFSWFSLVWLGLVWFGLVWFGFGFGLVWFCVLVLLLR